jgi:transcriptional regulator with XRE-family HTH domain
MAKAPRKAVKTPKKVRVVKASEGRVSDGLPPTFLKEWRIYRGYKTTAALADAAGMSRPEVSRLESNNRDYNRRNLEKLAKVLQCMPADLIGVDPTKRAGILEIYASITPKDRTDAEIVLAEAMSAFKKMPASERPGFLRLLKNFAANNN